MEEIKNIKDEEFETEVLKSDKPVLVDFWATWCMPCKMQAPVLHELLPEIEGKAKIIKVDVDECEKTAVRYGIMSIPTLVVFVGGEVKEKLVGLTQKEELLAVLSRYF